MKKSKEKLTADMVKKYLISNGWQQEKDFPNKNLLVFSYGNERVAISASEKYSDFFTTLNSAMQSISFILSKSTEQLVSELLEMECDEE